MLLTRVTLVPIDSHSPNVGPFRCREFRVFPEYFSYIDEFGEARHQPMRTPYCAVGEAFEETQADD